MATPPTATRPPPATRHPAPAFVTGASHGVGRAVAEAFAAAGRPVGLLARSRPDLEATLASMGGHGAIAVADVGDPAAVEAAMHELTSALGPPEVLVCSAGFGAYGPVRSTALAVVEELMRVNFRGTVHSTRAVLEDMISRRRGHIVVIGSVAGLVGVPLEAAYSASKFAVTGWAEALAAEVRHHGIGVTVVSPGPVDTGFFEARGTPYRRRRPKPLPAAVVAAAVLRAVERERAELVLPRRLRGAVVIRSAAPGLFRRGVGRSMRRELQESGA